MAEFFQCKVKLKYPNAKQSITQNSELSIATRHKLAEAKVCFKGSKPCTPTATRDLEIHQRLVRIIVPCCWKVVAHKWRIGKPKFHFLRKIFHFPRLDSCLAERSEAKQSKSRKMKVLSRKMKMRLRDSPFQSNYFHAAWIYFLCF